MIRNDLINTTHFDFNFSMSEQLKKCDRCQRSYHFNVYQRHISENQCLKRNQHRLPFQSVKQRTIRIGDRIYSVQPENSNAEVKTTISPVVSKTKTRSESMTRKSKVQPTSTQKPILSQSPKYVPRSLNRNAVLPPIDQTFTHAVSPPTRKAKTWTRTTKSSSNRKVISPINIPTCSDFSMGRHSGRRIVSDEFERFSPRLSSTPPRPITYKKTKVRLPPLLRPWR